jgi:hypothetical protein
MNDDTTTTTAAAMCFAGDGSMTCMLPLGHDGDHVAEDNEGREVARWAVGTGTDGPGGVPLGLEGSKE